MSEDANAAASGPAGHPEDARLGRGARRATVASAVVAVAFAGADGALLPPRSWLLLGVAVLWFVVGVRRVRVAVRAGAPRQVSRRIGLHYLPLVLVSVSVPVLAVAGVS